MCFQIADHVPLVQTPKFWNPKKAYMNYEPDLDAAFKEGVEVAKAEGLANAEQLKKKGIKNLLWMTDLEQDFRDKGSDDFIGRLPVPGCNTVALRVAARMINGTYMDYYSGIMYSQDGHPPIHISFDYYWRDQNGKALNAKAHGGAVIIDLVEETKAVFEVKAFKPDGSIYTVGYYQPAFDRKDAVAYYQHLQVTGQGSIWAFNVHCVLGTGGVSLHPLIAEALQFLCGARSIQPTIIFKGHISNTDWFGPLEPCRSDPNHPQGQFQMHVIDEFKEYNRVEESGVAEDFCAFFFKQQVLSKLMGTQYVSKLAFMKDGTAPIIPNQAKVIQINQDAKTAGVHFFNHDEAFAA